MKLYFINLIFPILILSPLSFAEGTAGARGGGTGVLCAGMQQPITVEEYKARENRTSIVLPMEHAQLNQWLNTRLSNYTTVEFSALFSTYLLAQGSRVNVPKNLAGAIGYFLSKVGTYDSWPSITESEISTLMGENNNRTPIENTILSSLEVYGITLSEQSSSRIVGDDLFRTPSGCRKVQLSLLSGLSVKKIANFTVSETTKRVLELHEAVYSLQMALLNLEYPLKVQTLVIALGSDDASTVQRAASDLIYQTSSRWVTRYPEIFGLQFLKLVGNHPACAPLMVFDEDEELIVTTLERKNNTNSGAHVSRRMGLHAKYEGHTVIATKVNLNQAHVDLIEPYERGQNLQVYRFPTEAIHLSRSLFGSEARVQRISAIEPILCEYQELTFDQGFSTINPTKVLSSLFPEENEISTSH